MRGRRDARLPPRRLRLQWLILELKSGIRGFQPAAGQHLLQLWLLREPPSASGSRDAIGFLGEVAMRMDAKEAWKGLGRLLETAKEGFGAV